jgi:predicted RNA-binding Zn ribbon-like protein
MKEVMARPQRNVASPQRHHSSAKVGNIHLISEEELSLDLINSVHYDYRGRKPPQDYLEQPEWIEAFSQHWTLPVTSPPNASTLASLRELRTLLRQMFETLVAGQQITEAQVEELNSFLAFTPMTSQIRRTGKGIAIEAVPLQNGWNAAITQIATSWADLLIRTPANCLRVCDNPACHWVFVDQSRSQSRRWCRQWACGNIMKVRRFRAQHALQTKG